MKTILLVRHGQSATNVQKVFTGQLDAHLTPMGIQQAKAMAQYVAKYPVEKVYVSSLTRAIETARPICELVGCPLETMDAFQELYAGAWEGLSFDEIAQRHPDTYYTWRQDIAKAQPNGGESCKQLYERVTQAFQRIVEDTQEQTICIVSHAIPIRMIESFITYGCVDGTHKTHWVPNASVTVYTYDGAYHLQQHGISDFLGTMQTNLPTNI